MTITGSVSVSLGCQKLSYCGGQISCVLPNKVTSAEATVLGLGIMIVTTYTT